MTKKKVRIVSAKKLKRNLSAELRNDSGSEGCKTGGSGAGFAVA